MMYYTPKWRQSKEKADCVLEFIQNAVLILQFDYGRLMAGGRQKLMQYICGFQTQS